MELTDLIAISDPEIQAEEAVEAMRKAEDYICQARAVRDNAIYLMSKAGKKPFDIAVKLDLSKSQVVSVIRLAKANDRSLQGPS